MDGREYVGERVLIKGSKWVAGFDSDRYIGFSLCRVYHVWCEAWMRRDDLPEGYNGWQVLDPTSQGRQSGRYRIGPASVTAIKEGLCGKKWLYDNEYVKSEVDSDVRYIRSTDKYSLCKPTSRLSVAHVNRDEVGVSIVTSSNRRGMSVHEPLDITALYKNTQPAANFPPGDNEQTFPSPSRDCSFHVETSRSVKLGEELSVSVKVWNKGAMLRTIDGKVVGSTILYTGEPVCHTMTMEFSGIVSPGQSK